MNIEDLKVDWEYMYDCLTKHNPGCAKKDFVETMEEIKECLIFENEEDLSRHRKEYMEHTSDINICSP